MKCKHCGTEREFAWRELIYLYVEKDSTEATVHKAEFCCDRCAVDWFNDNFHKHDFTRHDYDENAA